MQATAGTVGFSVACGRPPRTISANADQTLRGASTLKVGIVLADAIKNRSSGSAVRSDQGTQEAIINSDNSAANDLFARIGDGSPTLGAETTNLLFRALGMEKTRFDGPYVNTSARSQKVTTAGDLRILAESLERLARDGTGPLAAAGATEAQAKALLDLMTETDYPSVFSPVGGTVIAHKSGWLADAQNDLAVITFPGQGSCAAGFVSEGLSLSQAQSIGSALTQQVIAPLARAADVPAASRSTTRPTQTTATVTMRQTTTTTGATETAAGASAEAPAPVPPAAADGSDADASWWTDWGLWVFAGVGSLLVVLIARQRQVTRRNRERARRRGGRR